MRSPTLERTPQQDPQKPQESPDKIIPPGTNSPGDKPTPATNPDKNPIG